MIIEQLIDEFITKHVFPGIDWGKYNLHNHTGIYISCNYWTPIYYMFSLTKDETKYYLNKWVHANVTVPPDFSVIMESLYDVEIDYV